jgi:hypothetical protein
VDQLSAPIDQHTPDEQAAVAMRRVFFAAQQGDAILIGTALKAVDAAKELRAVGNLSIQGPAICIIKGFVLWSTADDVAKIEIACARLTDRVAEGLAVEVRDALGIRVRASVDEDLNAIRGKKLEEMVRWVR